MRASGCGHPGGALSCLDIVAALYFRTLNVDPAHPALPERDRFVLSAGHKCMAHYGLDAGGIAEAVEKFVKDGRKNGR